MSYNVESARVVAVSDDFLWVETIQQSTCSSCSSRSGCGQYALNKWQPKRQSHLKVPLGSQSASDFGAGDFVKIGVPEGLVLKSAVLVYILPLLVMLCMAMLAEHFVGSDIAAGIGAVLGLVLGFAGVKVMSNRVSSKPQNHPVLMTHGREENCYISTEVIELS